MAFVFGEGQGLQRHCIDVNITGDDGHENEEVYNVSLISTDSDVLLGAQSVTRLVITNTDGRWPHSPSINNDCGFAGFIVRFQQLTHEVLEGQTARICINIIGATDIVISVIVSTIPVDAEGEIYSFGASYVVLVVQQ